MKLHDKTAVRTAPSPDKPVLMMAASGEQFHFLRDSGKWLKVQLDGLQTGWIPTNHTAPFRADAKNIQIVQAKSNTHLYWGPGASFGIAAVLVEGCFLSNPQELNDCLFPDYQEKLSQGIYNGLLVYFGK